MLLSIIIRTWNRLEYTIRTIVSISEHCGLPKDRYEIICVDQNSNDGTKEWLRDASCCGYYPIKPIILSENVGDGCGMNVGFSAAKGEFFAQHDNDIELITPYYYAKLISLYKGLEFNRIKLCALSGSHKQGINLESTPMRFARERHGHTFFRHGIHDVHYSSWVTASFIFRKEFSSLEFTKGMCNSWCGEWFDRGYENILCDDLKFWHIDSDSEGGEYVQEQYKKFPTYTYIKRHYRPFLKVK